MGDQMDDDFAVRRGLENSAVGFELVTQYLRIDEVAVMGKRQIPEGEVHRERLNVAQIVAPGRGVTIVSDRHRTG